MLCHLIQHSLRHTWVNVNGYRSLSVGGFMLERLGGTGVEWQNVSVYLYCVYITYTDTPCCLQTRRIPFYITRLSCFLLDMIFEIGVINIRSFTKEILDPNFISLPVSMIWWATMIYVFVLTGKATLLFILTLSGQNRDNSPIFITSRCQIVIYFSEMKLKL